MNSKNNRRKPRTNRHSKMLTKELDNNCFEETKEYLSIHKSDKVWEVLWWYGYEVHDEVLDPSEDGKVYILLPELIGYRK